LAVTATVESNPGTSGVTFSAFNPCSTSATGSTWTLTDTRDSKTYKVKKMADGRYWMVQDLAFGTCTATSFKIDNSAGATTVTPTVATGYVGHCRTGNSTNHGYWYNWPAVMNNQQAYYGSSVSTFACSGTTTAVNSCQGICPAGWHVPSIDEFTDAQAKFSAAYNCTQGACFGPASAWEGVIGGKTYNNGKIRDNTQAFWCSSTYYDYTNNYTLAVWENNTTNAQIWSKNDGHFVRCARNY
jgi:uncharacterized protein (TIGR02145 family)